MYFLFLFTYLFSIPIFNGRRGDLFARQNLAWNSILSFGFETKARRRRILLLLLKALGYLEQRLTSLKTVLCVGSIQADHRVLRTKGMQLQGPCQRWEIMVQACILSSCSLSEIPSCQPAQLLQWPGESRIEQGICWKLPGQECL